VRAIDGVSISVAAGQVFSIIGPNGSGKTTLFNLVSGIYVPNDGNIRLAGQSVTGLAPDQLARRGLSRTFQNLQVFSRMSALENVMVGRHRHERTGVLADLLHWPTVARQRWRASGSPMPTSARQVRSLTASSSGSRSRGRSPASRLFCCSTSRRPVAIRSRPRKSIASSAPSWRRASPSCLSSTTCVW
jgi:branched-chain amino acid transport system ATP-binding protein